MESVKKLVILLVVVVLSLPNHNDCHIVKKQFDYYHFDVMGRYLYFYDPLNNYQRTRDLTTVQELISHLNNTGSDGFISAHTQYVWGY